MKTYRINVVIAILWLLPCGRPTSAQDAGVIAQPKAIETTVCKILENPAAFNNKLVRVRGRVGINFEYSLLSADECTDAIWFSYGDASGPPGLAATIDGTAVPGSKNKQGLKTTPIRIQLLRDSNFNNFEKLLSSTVKADPQCPPTSCSQQVLATFVGRIDGVSKQIHAAHQKKLSNSKPDFNGFGQLGQFDAQLVMQSVGSDAVVEMVVNGRVLPDQPPPL